VLDLFSGIGGFSLGLERAGMQTIAFCERDEFCQRVLAKHWPEVPIHDDITTLDGTQYRGAADVVCGGFPCQDISYAGNGAGLAGERSGLWFEFARIIREVEPDFVLVENVAALLTRGMGDVLGTLASLGFDAEWDCVSACAVGHTHMRRRVFIVAYANRLNGRSRIRDSLTRAFRALPAINRFQDTRASQKARLENPSALYGGAHGVPYGMERNRGHGNAIVPQIPEQIGLAVMEAAA
jgi:DNA (cytosine-5)-methyltransferase 1